ncbi:MAG: rhomboid family intramembrane serine protease [Chitinophagaceae bacterium]
MFSITLTIIIVTCLFTFVAFNREKVKEDLLFWPAEINSRGQYYRFLSYGLIHADLQHVIFNMFTLYSFGSVLEKYTFSRYDIFADKARIFYLVLYVSALVISTLPDYFKYKNNFSYRALGASGAVSAILFASIIIDPKLSLYLFFIPIPIPGYIFGVIFLALSAYMAKRGRDNIGHGAHFTGAIYGLIFTIAATKLFSNYDTVQIFINVILNR